MYKSLYVLIMLSLIWAATIAQGSTIMLAQVDTTRASVLPDTIIGPPPGIGDVFRDSVYMTNGRLVFAWALWMTYNPKVLNCVGVEEGPFMKPFGPTIFAYKLIDNVNGLIEELVCCFTEPFSYVDSNTATLCYIDWQVMDTGSSILGLDRVYIIDVLGNEHHCTTDSGYFRLSGGPGVVNEVQPQNPLEYLSQAYPNPFREKTVISYQLSAKSDVSLKIYDLSGRLIRTIVDGLSEPGSYTVEWDGSNSWRRKVASGVYFYKLQTCDEVATKKLTVLQ